MFGKKRDEKDQKKKSKIDKLIMGAIVGGAIGSVVGMSLAPKKGKDTREFIAKKGKDILEKGKQLTDKIHSGMAERPKKKLLSRIKEKIFGRPKEKAAVLASEDEMKKIPHEFEQ
jgi:gas vesicle protein